MTPLDTELFNEFKRLDKLLRESRRTERGVSSYIDDMKAVNEIGARHIPNWRTDLDWLWQCRHVRNRLAHDATSEVHSLCDRQHVEFLKNFYARVLNGRDPLAQLERLRRGTRSTAKSPSPRVSPHSTPPASAQQGCLTGVILTVAATMLTMGLFCVIVILLSLTQ